MLMGILTTQEDQATKHVLSDFMEASGNSIKQGKSQIFFFNTLISIQGFWDIKSTLFHQNTLELHWWPTN